MIQESILQLSISLFPVLLGIVVHEVAHGYVAYRLGDPTPKLAGRLTLSPFAHIDAVGAVIFLLTALFTPIALGWAKPIPVDPRYFRNVRKDMVYVALAGPVSNFLLAFVFAIFLKLMLLNRSFMTDTFSLSFYLISIARAGILINLLLAFFNLLPIPTFDGAKVLAYFLPREWAFRYEQYQNYGFIIALVLLMLGVIGAILMPIVNFFYLLFLKLLAIL